MNTAPRLSPERVVDASTVRFERCAQSALSPSYRRTSLAGLLGSTGITPLPGYYEPIRLPARPAGGYVFPPPVEAATSPHRVSQVPRPICLRALSPTTPEGPMAACARCSAIGGGLPPLWQVGRTSIGVTRPNRVRLRYGSRIRSAGLRYAGHPNAPPTSLPAERAICRATTFQVTRSARLSLAHQRRKGAKSLAFESFHSSQQVSKATGI